MDTTLGGCPRTMPPPPHPAAPTIVLPALMRPFRLHDTHYGSIQALECPTGGNYSLLARPCGDEARVHSIHDSLHTGLLRLNSPMPTHTCLCIDTTSASFNSSGSGCGMICMR